MGNSMVLLNAISVGCGFYCLYTWLRLLFTKKLFKNGILVPKDKTVDDCLDEQEYIRYIMPSLSVLGIVTTIYGVFFWINDSLETPILPYPWGFIPLVVVLGVLIWYAVVNSRANKEFFNM